MSRTATTLAVLGTLVALPASAAVLLAGYGVAGSDDAARAAAREDLAVRLQRAVVVRLKTDAARRAFPEGREFPLIAVELAKMGGGRYEARLTDASLAAYEREADLLAEKLRKADPARLSAAPDKEVQLAECFAWLDQHRRATAVLRAFSSKRIPEAGIDEAALSRLAAKSLAPLADPGEVAKIVKTALGRSGVSGVRVVAPVRSDTSEVTELSGIVADGLRGELGTSGERGARRTLDGVYQVIEGRILLKLFLLDASFNTERAFAFALPNAPVRSYRSLPAASGLADALSRGLVRVDMADGGAAPDNRAMGVDVQTDRGRRGLYYHAGDRDRLLVKLDRPGYYYIVGHLAKGDSRLSYLMEIGDPATGSRFVRRVGADGVNQWQPVGEFTVEPPFGMEAIQVLAASENPERALPPARLDPSRNLYVIGTDPSEAVKRTRGLVLINMGDPGGKPGATAPRSSVGEAVLQFTTLP